ncbi:hypothetical protein CK203_110245 [Vitis vinifera]|uniref:Integrase catalytic domain-containing protein n=1 Tax=Vitis vinifera TaxID=29760 RepID=A0A438CVV8_VITVI|nr:hypothetical protein CK203_110245 [Vitis vinifera]
MNQRMKQRKRRGRKSKEREKEQCKEEDLESTVNEEPERTINQEDMMKKHTPPPFPQALHGKKGINNASEILEVLRQVKVNIPLLDMIKQVPTYAKFLKDLCTIKRVQVSSEIQNLGCPNLSDDWRDVCGESFVGLGSKCEFATYSVYQQLGLGELKPTSITLSLADRSMKIPRGMVEDVLVQVDKFYYPVDFVEWSHATYIWQHDDRAQHLLFARNNSIGRRRTRRGLPEPSDLLATLPPWKRREKFCLYSMGRRQEAVKEEPPKLILKPLPTELNPWVSPTQVVPKKSGITVVQNDKGEEVSTRLTSSWSDMVERIMEVFMDDITIYGRIVLGHIISKQGIEVDKAKVELIIKLPSVTTVKGVRQFLGHVRTEAILMTAPIVRAPNWQLPFELTKLDAKAKLIILASRVQSSDQRQEMRITHVDRSAPWYAHIANYLVTGEVPMLPTRATGDPQLLPRKRMWRPLCFSEDNYEAKYGVKHKVYTLPPQTSGQVELANQEIKNILMKVVNMNRRDWSVKLHEFTMGIQNNLQDHSWNVSLSLVYGKACHLPVEVEYKAWWAIKKLNMDLSKPA